MSCTEVTENIEAYVLKALEPDEMEAVENHLKECPKCRAWLENYRQVAQSFALEYSFGRVPVNFELPAGHAARFSNRLQKQVQAEKRRSRGRPFWSFAAALILAASFFFGFGTWVVNLQTELNRQQATIQALSNRLENQSSDVKAANALNERLQSDNKNLSSEKEELRRQLVAANAAQQQVATAQRINLLLTKPDATMRSTVGAESGLTVLMSPQERTVGLLAHSWPSLKPGQEYRIWLKHTTGALIAGGSVNLVLLPGSPNILEAVIEAPETMANYTGLFVTIEVAGSANRPTGPEIARIG